MSLHVFACEQHDLFHLRPRLTKIRCILLYTSLLVLIYTLLFITHMSIHKRRPSATEKLADAAKHLEKRIENVLTILWDDLPAWQQDNHFIRSGYRPASASFKKSFASLGYIHNESVNIYSHLLGAILFSVIGLVLYTAIEPRYESATTSDVLAFGCFFAGAALCLGMSATFHSTMNHSPSVARFGNKLDYMGIVFLISGSFIPSVFYGFYCHPHLQEFYWTMVCNTLPHPFRLTPTDHT